MEKKTTLKVGDSVTIEYTGLNSALFKKGGIIIEDYSKKYSGNVYLVRILGEKSFIDLAPECYICGVFPTNNYFECLFSSFYLKKIIKIKPYPIVDWLSKYGGQNVNTLP